jgi:hypothetical protein
MPKRLILLLVACNAPFIAGCFGSSDDNGGTTPPECQLDSKNEKTPGFPYNIDKFGKDVLPLLVAKCSAAGCHGAPVGSSGFTVWADAKAGDCNAAKTFNSFVTKVDLTTTANSPVISATNGGNKAHPFSFAAAATELTTLQAFLDDAKATNDKVKVITDYVSTSDFTVAFNNPGEGKNFADQFIATNHPDVVFQVAGKTGNGILESACTNGLIGIGVDVDQWQSLSAATDPTYGCIVTSAEKHLSASVSNTIQQIYLGNDLGLDPFGALHFNAANAGIGISPEQDDKGLITPEIQAAVDAALAGMADGSVVTCPPDSCGTAQ